MALRWGIASAGKISHDFVTAVHTLPASDHKVVAVGAQDLKRAKDFAALHKIPTAYKSYEELAKDPNVDIVYVGNLMTQHFPVSKLMLENGKHVLCEKSMCVNHKQAKELIEFAEKKKLFLMEAIWSRFFPSYLALKEHIDSGALGEILQTRVEMGVPISEVDRIKSKELGGGTVLDLGIYVLQFSQLIFKKEPKKILVTGHLNESGVDTSFSGVLTYENGGTASISTHSKGQFPNEAFVLGTKGYAKLSSPFWCPLQLRLVDGTVKTFDLPKGDHEFNFENSCGLRYEAEECRRCIKAGLIESPGVSHKETLLLSKLQDEVRKQLGYKFAEDD